MRYTTSRLNGRLAALATLITLTFSPTASPAEVAQCEIAPFRGATRPGGTTTTMTVVNDGAPCLIRNFIEPDTKTLPPEVRPVAPPKNGTLTFPGPGVVAYTRRPGFSGSDSFAFAGHGRTQAGRAVEMFVAVTVNVLRESAGGTKEEKKP